MRWNIGSTSTAPTGTALPDGHPPVASSSTQPPSECPMHKADVPKPSRSGAAKCPVDHDAQQAMLKAKPSAAKCPVPHDTKDDLNPLNSIPKNLSIAKQPGQVMDLSTERTASSIPRARDADGQDEGDVWDYPSPQQFYNALVRKGWETPEESMEVVTEIHNFLNEAAWEEVMKWERRVPGGESAQLARFQGRPGDLSPKARFWLAMGKILPSKFNSAPPFDRHDWILKRPATGGNEVRYVIDYYSAPPDENGMPVFSLDVRPALDSLESINQRIKVGFEEWMKGDQA